MTTFAELGLSDAVLAAVDHLGYTEPTPVQAQAIPLVLQGRDIIAAAKTGTAQTGVYDENGEEIENYWYAGYICNAQEEPLYTLVVLEETAGEMHVPQAFRKIGEALVDFN